MHKQQRPDFFSFFKFLILLNIPGVAHCGVLSFFTNSDTDLAIDLAPELTLVPANATISKNVTVTLGCKSNVKARLCRWSFYPASDPGERKDLAPFSPMSREQKQKGRVSDKDCSLRITRVSESHSGKWVCAVMPLANQKQFLVSKGAHLTVLDFRKLAEREKAFRERERKEREQKGDHKSMPHSLFKCQQH